MTPSAAWAVSGTSRSGWDVTVVRQDGEVVADERLAELSEAALVELSLTGRAEAFDLIVERHRRQVYQLCYRFVGNHEDASDLAQDVFVRAFRGVARFRGHASLGTWL